MQIQGKIKNEIQIQCPINNLHQNISLISQNINNLNQNIHQKVYKCVAHNDASEKSLSDLSLHDLLSNSKTPGELQIKIPNLQKLGEKYLNNLFLIDQQLKKKIEQNQVQVPVHHPSERTYKN